MFFVRSKSIFLCAGSLIFQSVNLSLEMAVQNASCVFAFFGYNFVTPLSKTLLFIVSYQSLKFCDHVEIKKIR